MTKHSQRHRELMFVLIQYGKEGHFRSSCSYPLSWVQGKTAIVWPLNVASMWHLRVHTHSAARSAGLLKHLQLSTPSSGGLWWPLNHRLDTQSRHVTHFSLPTLLLHKTGAWLLWCYVHMDTHTAMGSPERPGLGCTDASLWSDSYTEQHRMSQSKWRSWRSLCFQNWFSF